MKATGRMGLLSMNSSLWPFSQKAPVNFISKLVSKPSYTCVGVREIGILNKHFFTHAIYLLSQPCMARKISHHSHDVNNVQSTHHTWASNTKQRGRANLPSLISKYIYIRSLRFMPRSSLKLAVLNYGFQIPLLWNWTPKPWN